MPRAGTFVPLITNGAPSGTSYTSFVMHHVGFAVSPMANAVH